MMFNLRDAAMNADSFAKKPCANLGQLNVERL